MNDFYSKVAEMTPDRFSSVIDEVNVTEEVTWVWIPQVALTLTSSSDTIYATGCISL